MLSVTGSPTWRTVTGGSGEYVRLVAKSIGDIRLNTPVRAVHRFDDRVDIRDGDDQIQTFAAAVVATHPQQALKILADPTPAESQGLVPMPFSANTHKTHTNEKTKD